MRTLVSGLALVFCVSALNGCSSSTPSTPSSGTGTSVSIVSGSQSFTTNAYSPNPITVQVGGTVTWMNNDSTAHTSTSDSGAWDSATLAPGASFSRTFQTAGTFPYHCTIHPNMVGTVNVQ